MTRTLTTRELNRALLARQFLLERSRLPLTRTLERIGGLQAQYSPSAYVGLWTRLEGFRRDDLTQALERRRAIQGTLMRTTIHIVSAGDYPLFAAATRGSRREGYRKRDGDTDMAAVAARVRRALADGPRRRRELVEVVGDTTVWNGIGAWVDLVRVPPSGTWEQRRADLYGLADDWLGPSEASATEGFEHLLRRYLVAFGPARLADAASWAGVAPARLAPVAERLRLRRFEDESGRELVDVPRSPLPGGDTAAPARFLPVWDANLLAHARRTGILPEEYRPVIFNAKTPHSMNTFLVDGAVTGTWRVERTKEKARLLVEAFERLPAGARRELEAEGKRLVRFHEPDAASHEVSVAGRA